MMKTTKHKIIQETLINQLPNLLINKQNILTRCGLLDHIEVTIFKNDFDPASDVIYEIHSSHPRIMHKLVSFSPGRMKDGETLARLLTQACAKFEWEAEQFLRQITMFEE